MTKRTFHAAMLVLAVLLNMSDSARADDEDNREYEIKAAFIYNFAQFTVWPDKAFASDDSPFVVAVVGQDPFNHALESACEGKSIAGHPMEVRHIDSLDQIEGCHLLFVPETEDDHLDDIFKVVADRPILTVGESPKFPWAGGTIRFLIEDHKMRFEVNPDAAAKAALRISSKLMSLARIFKRS